MNERINFFIKIYIPHTLFSRWLMFLLCARDEWRQRKTAILTQLLLLIIAALLLHLGWGCSNGGRWGSQPLVCQLALTLAFLSPTNSTAAGTCLYSFITPTCFRFFFHLFTQVHLRLTARSRVNIQHISWTLFYVHIILLAKCQRNKCILYVVESDVVFDYILQVILIHCFRAIIPQPVDDTFLLSLLIMKYPYEPS